MKTDETETKAATKRVLPALYAAICNELGVEESLDELIEFEHLDYEALESAVSSFVSSAMEANKERLDKRCAECGYEFGEHLAATSKCPGNRRTTFTTTEVTKKWFMVGTVRVRVDDDGGLLPPDGGDDLRLTYTWTVDCEACGWTAMGDASNGAAEDVARRNASRHVNRFCCMGS